MNRRLAMGINAGSEQEPAAEAIAVVAIGANLGEREATVAAAIAELDRLPLSHLVTVAEPLESVAVTLNGLDEDAPRYLNTVALVATRLSPSILLGMLHAIEARHGRERRERWGDRTLDLDLITYGNVRSDDPALLLPHPRAAERDFVLEPWLAADPEAVLPGIGAVAEILASRRAAE